MTQKKSLKPVALAIGATFAASLAGTSVANAADNPFGASKLSSGYMVAAAEGKCGEGKCGAGMMKEKAAEGKCGAATKEGVEKAAEGKCGAGMEKATEGKCGAGMKEGMEKATEGKCGGKK
jgi:uncharacterized low-complexity protein